MRAIKIFTIIMLIIVSENYLPSDITANVVVRSTALPSSFEVGHASYYSYECANLPMANGQPFDPQKRTCASWFYDFGTVLYVQSLDTGRITKVVVTDRGPNKRLVKKGRVIDLSMKAFADICDIKKGLTRVVILVKDPPQKYSRQALTIL